MASSIGRNQPDRVYRRHPAIAQSHLKSILVSPAHYKAALSRPFPATANMVLGSALHCLVLEGRQVFEAQYIERPEDLKLTTKEGKEWAAQQKEKGLTVLTGEQTKQLNGMAAALGKLDWFDPKHQSTLGPLSELSVYWDWCGLDCKARLDRVIELPDKVLVLDLKTTDSVSPKKFLDKVLGLNYLFQAGYYTEAAAVAFKKPAEFVFVGVERDLPNCVDFFTPAADMVAEARDQCIHALKTLKTCLLTDEWPGPPPQMHSMSLPPWYASPVPRATLDEPAEPLF